MTKFQDEKAKKTSKEELAGAGGRTSGRRMDERTVGRSVNVFFEKTCHAEQNRSFESKFDGFLNSFCEGKETLRLLSFSSCLAR